MIYFINSWKVCLCTISMWSELCRIVQLFIIKICKIKFVGNQHSIKPMKCLVPYITFFAYSYTKMTIQNSSLSRGDGCNINHKKTDRGSLLKIVEKLFLSIFYTSKVPLLQIDSYFCGTDTAVWVDLSRRYEFR